MPKTKGEKRPDVLLIHNLDKSWTRSEMQTALKETKAIENCLRKSSNSLVNIPVRKADLYSLLKNYNPEDYVIFNCCEGLPGISHSESRVVAILEGLKYSFTGSPSDTLELCWDKKKTKLLLDRHGVSTPKWRIYESPQLMFDDWNNFPAIVKPAKEHCSIGVTPEAVVLTKAELKKRISYVLNKFSQPALVEDFIDGREFHVTVWGNEQAKMFPPAEMDFSSFDNIHDRLCTYDSKFEPDSLHYKKIRTKVPAELSKKEHETLRKMVTKAYRVIGCRDYARIDLRLRNGIFYVLDVNANPDISKETTMATAAKHLGHSYSDMLGIMLNMAVKRHHLKKNRPSIAKKRPGKSTHYQTYLFN